MRIWLRQKWWWLFAIMFFVAMLAVGLLLFAMLTRTGHQISSTTFERIQIGMSDSEVESILECPPGDYCGRMLWTSSDSPLFLETWSHPESVRWIGDRGVIVLVYDADRKVAIKVFGQVHADTLAKRIQNGFTKLTAED
jgi:hypothetical protein